MSPGERDQHVQEEAQEVSSITTCQMFALTEAHLPLPQLGCGCLGLEGSLLLEAIQWGMRVCPGRAVISTGSKPVCKWPQLYLLLFYDIHFKLALCLYIHWAKDKQWSFTNLFKSGSSSLTKFPALLTHLWFSSLGFGFNILPEKQVFLFVFLYSHAAYPWVFVVVL